uniref:Putative secreted protein n=1 Tax=Ixodes scapularis TaxID=6945 RepID=A0A4D5S6R6_IXOSC
MRCNWSLLFNPLLVFSLLVCCIRKHNRKTCIYDCGVCRIGKMSLLRQNCVSLEVDMYESLDAIQVLFFFF